MSLTYGTMYCTCLWIAHLALDMAKQCLRKAYNVNTHVHKIIEAVIIFMCVFQYLGRKCVQSSEQ
jgi:hypothetical protein